MMLPILLIGTVVILSMAICDRSRRPFISRIDKALKLFSGGVVPGKCGSLRRTLRSEPFGARIRNPNSDLPQTRRAHPQPQGPRPGRMLAPDGCCV
jgi:hypothetical protein